MLQFDTLRPETLDALYELEKLCFPIPWTKEALSAEMNKENAVYILLVENGDLIGYCSFFSAADSADIMNIAVHPAYRRQGYGKMLLKRAIELAKQSGICQMYLEVRVSNHAAQALYTRFGFTRAGVRKKYYADNAEDAVIMVKDW